MVEIFAILVLVTCAVTLVVYSKAQARKPKRVRVRPGASSTDRQTRVPEDRC